MPSGPHCRVKRCTRTATHTVILGSSDIVPVQFGRSNDYELQRYELRVCPKHAEQLGDVVEAKTMTRGGKIGNGRWVTVTAEKAEGWRLVVELVNNPETHDAVVLYPPPVE